MNVVALHVVSVVVHQGDNFSVCALLTPLLLLMDNHWLVDLHHLLEVAVRHDGLRIDGTVYVTNVIQVARSPAGGSEAPCSEDGRGLHTSFVVGAHEDALTVQLELLLVLALLLLDRQPLDLHHLEDVRQVGAARASRSGCTESGQSRHVVVVVADGRLQHKKSTRSFTR
jgi:hypothetical protein